MNLRFCPLIVEVYTYLLNTTCCLCLECFVFSCARAFTVFCKSDLGVSVILCALLLSGKFVISSLSCPKPFSQHFFWQSESCLIKTCHFSSRKLAVPHLWWWVGCITISFNFSCNYIMYLLNFSGKWPALGNEPPTSKLRGWNPKLGACSLLHKLWALKLGFALILWLGQFHLVLVVFLLSSG